jgi:hypothetical protein
MIAEYGPQYPDKPVRLFNDFHYNQFTLWGQVDLLSWLLDDMPKEVATNETIARYFLALNFAAIHTSSTVRYYYTGH